MPKTPFPKKFWSIISAPHKENTWGVRFETQEHAEKTMKEMQQKLPKTKFILMESKETCPHCGRGY